MVLPGATDILPDTPLPAGMLSTPPAQIRKYLPPCSPCPSCFWKEDCPRFKGSSHPEWEAALAQLINLKTQKKALEEEIGELESRLKVAYQLSHTVRGEWINTGKYTFRVIPQNGRVTLDRKRLNEESLPVYSKSSVRNRIKRKTRSTRCIRVFLFMFLRSFFELAVLLGRLAKPPFYGYGLCNEHSHAGIKFNELGWLNLNPTLSAIWKFQDIR